MLRRTVIAHTADELYRLRFAWERLYLASPATIFQSFTWNLVAARMFAARERPYVVYCETDSGAALIPAAIQSNSGKLSLMGERLFDYRGVLTVGGNQALDHAWERLAELRRTFCVGGIRPESVSAWDGFELREFYSAPRVSPRETSADSFAAEHSRFARAFRKLERQGIAMKQYDGSNSELVRWVYVRKAEQPGDQTENAYEDPRRVEFMTGVAAAAPSSIEIFTLEKQDTRIAALVTLKDRFARRFYTIWFNREWAKYSPGLALVFEVTRCSLLQGVECDYMTGSHDFKLRLASSVAPMYWVEASPFQLGRREERQLPIAA